MSACQGCGGPLAPSRGRVPRKWCSDRCRRHTLYSRPCADCGTPTYDGTAHPPERCTHCSPRQMQIAAVRAKWLSHRTMIETMWADGLKVGEIRVAAGIPTWTPGPYRSRGYDLPHRRTPEQIARIVAGRAKASAAA